MASTLGFSVVDKRACDHQGTFEWERLVGFGTRRCTNCGVTWVLVKLEDDRLAFEKVLEPDECADVPGVREAVLDLPEDDAVGDVPSEQGEG